ncbi:MAG: FAD-dependent monooxygenase [Taibaiella sp.]|nr:FAD-dependent monooxygenase [Taibaiella sp.]
MEVAIIGAGIGGLTLALYLKRQGIIPVIYESATAIEPAGAGIMLAYNAMQVFEDLGLAESIIAAGNKIKGFEVSDQKERLIMATSLDHSHIKKGIYNVAIHRADLQRILAAAVGDEHILLSRRLKSIEKGSKIKLLFEDDHQATCDLLFGADGIKSVVRTHLAPQSTLRDTGQVCWRGICTTILPDLKSDIAIEQWGLGQRFGYVLLNPGQIYWFAVSNEKYVVDGKLPERLQSFNPVVQQLVTATPATKIIYSKIADLSPLPYWYQANICLIGDAAHATTPNMGQGGCQAIEDAYTIGKLLEQGYALKDTFPLLQQLRRKRVKKIVQQSRLLGHISQLENKYAAAFRNFALRLTAPSAGKKQLNFIINLDYI